MAFWARQISIWCSSVKTSNVANSIQRLRKTHRTWMQLDELSVLSLLCTDNRFLQRGLKTYRPVSLGSRLQSTNSSNGQIVSSESNLLSPVNHYQQQAEVIPSSDTKTLYEVWEDTPPSSALEEISEEEAVQIVAEPPLPLGSFTLRDYVDRSETLSKLVLLGVDLSKVEKRPNAGQLLLRLDFEKDIRKILLFLKDVGVEDNQLGPFLTQNPYILAVDMEALETRVAYLKSKKFGKEAVARMVSRAPFLLSFSVERLDNRLGFFQKELGLSVQKTRDLVVRLPRLLTGSLEPIKENWQVCQVELGFRRNEIQHIVSQIPKILTANKRKLTETFDYLHNVMGIPHHILTKFPQVFNSKLLRVKERHMFLTFLGRAQYDPAQPSYISLDKLVSMPDEVFCTEVAKASVKDFEKFLKTL
ncbi:transcription termination factor 3, mitochondrial [Malaclemys terrapin pileata]|uniref:transcription termination factor 3, mitochondrial n=1 Tax=Malaclemys terrapin pileata TaxID=2991368 RepID=UPI0023A7DD01|nr:transcription termination factor 3, mitochondrial [Malaclemys terrapin pileata]XP_053876496.1 transcription termination factor 3, mitochondrial [Malaclemys terrapin pileata]XP_053876498.1 transcription termination factor 3, mitochondrial [Malaclemys terrapin pileata]